MYRCAQCGVDSGMSDCESPVCFYCDAEEGLTLISKELITPEALAARLKASTDRMMQALRDAYDVMPKDDAVPDNPDEDMEKQMLEIMARAQEFRNSYKTWN